MNIKAAENPQIKMLVISGFDESLYAERALRAGALGYLNKQESNENLLEAIGKHPGQPSHEAVEHSRDNG